jgi:hypothetical protein
LMDPLLQYIERVSEETGNGEVITVVVPEFVPEHRWTGALHTQTAFWLRSALLYQKGIVITEVPYQT